MKKIIFSIIACFFTAFIAQSQNTCIDAKQLFSTWTNDTIPPPGTISPTGPDLGCLLTTGRQLWYYIPICKTTFFSTINSNFFGAWNDSSGIIIYGPFNQKVSDCSDLTFNKIISCQQANSNSGGFYISITDTLPEGSYLYVLLTYSNGIGGLVSSEYYSGFTNCFECNNNVSGIYTENLCMVSVDTSINKCILTWEEFPNNNLAGYNIYRETTLTGVYDSLTTIPVGSSSTYTDMTSSPAQHNFTYQVRGIDSCGNSYGVQSGGGLTSIHLISFAGGNNQANLIWNNVYTNNNFIPQYYIHRNNNGTGWQVIDSIGITLPTITYTDIFAPAGNNQYTVELRKLVPCIPMRMSSNPYTSVFSNTSITTVTGTEEFLSNSSISIYPNPANDYLCIYNNFTSEKEITIHLFSLYGQKLKTLYIGKTSVGKQEQKFSLKEYPAGIYFVKMILNGKEVVRKVVKYSKS